MEIKKLIKTYKIYMQCPQCQKGVMTCKNLVTSLMRISLCEEKPQFIHVCDKCGYTDEYERVYPYEEVEEVEV